LPFYPPLFSLSLSLCVDWQWRSWLTHSALHVRACVQWEGVVLIFAVRPFDIGDRITIPGAFYAPPPVGTSA
jgi:hypothetical protein